MDFKKLTARAKGLVDKRGGKDALKDDLSELKDIAKGQGSVSDKAKAAAEALKDPGRKGADAAADTPAGGEPATPAPPTPSAPGSAAGATPSGDAADATEAPATGPRP